VVYEGQGYNSPDRMNLSLQNCFVQIFLFFHPLLTLVSFVWILLNVDFFFSLIRNCGIFSILDSFSIFPEDFEIFYFLIVKLMHMYYLLTEENAQKHQERMRYQASF
jgi:hypothetical protein